MQADASCLFSQLLQLQDVPFRIFGATAKDQFRKPMPGMWYELENIFGQDGIEIGVLFPSMFASLDEILFDRQICLILRR